MAQNEAVSSARSRAEAMVWAVKQSKAFQNPRGRFSLGRKTVESAEGSLFEAEISQPIFFPGKKKIRTRLAELDAEASRHRQSKIESDVAQEVAELAYDHAIFQKKLDFAEKRLQRMTLVKSYLQGHVFASPQKQAERSVVEYRLMDLSAEKIKAESELVKIRERIGVLVNIEGNSEIDVQVPWLAGTRAVNEDQWKAGILAKNPDLLEQKLSVLAAKAQNSLDFREAWPDVEATLFVGQESAGEMEKTAGGGLSMPLPVFNRNRSGAARSGLNARAEAELLALEEKKLSAGIKILLMEIRASRELVRLYPMSLISSLEKDVGAAESEFRKGRADLLIYLELEDEVAETYDHCLEAQKSLADSLTHLFTMAGDKDFSPELVQY
ncbi:MAG: hypothetical protein A2901_04400 [Elusimicrobia bacterium RIFCSPLOWO2_01_FULL_54_10]|nr:MAG: hypothetical protein A2901_04400 [Elusimicrobia bacterium RIFCSPLOWO2_01_FULL_54_10]